ncbi:unnamed protein product [Enterobius vermicularis]|uniref:Shortage in chiasmata 1 n=1 Tax=Enterobius vermicularis TaxID=51028 RepID=A0A0N4V516_ENTVE|nr:unnamed protein product [Enterobius vermicularis]
MRLKLNKRDATAGGVVCMNSEGIQWISDINFPVKDHKESLLTYKKDLDCKDSKCVSFWGKSPCVVFLVKKVEEGSAAENVVGERSIGVDEEITFYTLLHKPPSHIETDCFWTNPLKTMTLSGVTNPESLHELKSSFTLHNTVENDREKEKKSFLNELSPPRAQVSQTYFLSREPQAFSYFSVIFENQGKVRDIESKVLQCFTPGEKTFYGTYCLNKGRIFLSAECALPESPKLFGLKKRIIEQDAKAFKTTRSKRYNVKHLNSLNSFDSSEYSEEGLPLKQQKVQGDMFETEILRSSSVIYPTFLDGKDESREEWKSLYNSSDFARSLPTLLDDVSEIERAIFEVSEKILKQEPVSNAHAELNEELLKATLENAITQYQQERQEHPADDTILQPNDVPNKIRENLISWMDTGRFIQCSKFLEISNHTSRKDREEKSVCEEDLNKKTGLLESNVADTVLKSNNEDQILAPEMWSLEKENTKPIDLQNNAVERELESVSPNVEVELLDTKSQAKELGPHQQLQENAPNILSKLKVQISSVVESIKHGKKRLRSKSPSKNSPRIYSKTGYFESADASINFNLHRKPERMFAEIKIKCCKGSTFCKGRGKFKAVDSNNSQTKNKTGEILIPVLDATNGGGHDKIQQNSILRKFMCFRRVARRGSPEDFEYKPPAKNDVGEAVSRHFDDQLRPTETCHTVGATSPQGKLSLPPDFLPYFEESMQLEAVLSSDVAKSDFNEAPYVIAHFKKTSVFEKIETTIGKPILRKTDEFPRKAHFSETDNCGCNVGGHKCFFDRDLQEVNLRRERNSNSKELSEPELDAFGEEQKKSDEMLANDYKNGGETSQRQSYEELFLNFKWKRRPQKFKVDAKLVPELKEKLESSVEKTEYEVAIEQAEDTQSCAFIMLKSAEDGATCNLSECHLTIAGATFPTILHSENPEEFHKKQPKALFGRTGEAVDPKKESKSVSVTISARNASEAAYASLEEIAWGSVKMNISCSPSNSDQTLGFVNMSFQPLIQNLSVSEGTECEKKSLQSLESSHVSQGTLSYGDRNLFSDSIESLNVPTYILKEGSTATITCELNSLTSTEVIWYKGQKQIEFKPGKIDRISHNLVEVLVISQINLEDSDIYNILVNDRLYPVACLIVEEEIGGKESIKFLNPPQTLFVMEGQPAVLTCQLSGPGQSLIWTKGERVIQASERIKLTSDPNGFYGVHISNTTIEDQGTYCARYGKQVSTVTLVVEGLQSHLR